MRAQSSVQTLVDLRVQSLVKFGLVGIGVGAAVGSEEVIIEYTSRLIMRYIYIFESQYSVTSRDVVTSGSEIFIDSTGKKLALPNTKFVN
jgi:hypothetical protein